MEYVLNEDKVKEFLSNKELPLDYIFDEIQGLFSNDIIQEILNLPFDIFDESNLCFLIEEAVNIDNNQDQNTSNEVKNNENLNNVKQLSEKQMSRMKVKQLQKLQTLQQDLYRNANNFNDSKFCTQAVQNPKQFMAQNTASLQNMPKSVRSDIINAPTESKWSIKSIQAKALKVFGVVSAIEMFGQKLIPKEAYTSFRNADGTISWVGTNFSPLRWASTKIGELIGLDFLKFKSGTTWAEKGINGVSKDVQDAFGSGTWMMYIFLALMLIPLIIKLFNYIFKKNNNVKKQQYAQTNNILKENITIEMLYESNDRYYLELAILNEAENIINATKPTSKMGSLLKIINKGIINLLKLSKGTEEALRNNSISCFTAAISNFLISVGNIVLVLAKGALLLMVSKEEKQRQEQNLRDQREEVFNKK